jgi:hypothetical protein
VPHALSQGYEAAQKSACGRLTKISLAQNWWGGNAWRERTRSCSRGSDLLESEVNDVLEQLFCNGVIKGHTRNSPTLQ